MYLSALLLITLIQQRYSECGFESVAERTWGSKQRRVQAVFAIDDARIGLRNAVEAICGVASSSNALDSLNPWMTSSFRRGPGKRGFALLRFCNNQPLAYCCNFTIVGVEGSLKGPAISFFQLISTSLFEWNAVSFWPENVWQRYQLTFDARSSGLCPQTWTVFLRMVLD